METPPTLECRKVQDITQSAFWDAQTYALRQALDPFPTREEKCRVTVWLEPPEAANYGSGIADADVIIELETVCGFKPRVVEEALRHELALIAGDEAMFTRTVNEHGNPTYTIRARALQEAFAHTRHPSIAKKYPHAVHEKHLDEAMEALPEDKRHDHSHRMAKLLTGDLDTDQPAIPVEYLARLANPEYSHQITDPHNPYFPQRVLALMEKNPRLAVETARQIKKLGFSRVSLMSGGSSSLAFQGTNEQGESYWILVTPREENRVPHPMMLPEIARATAMADDDLLTIRVMPPVDTEVSGEELETFEAALKATGLKPFIAPKGSEIRPGNVGHYRWQDDKGEHSVLMVLDWGAVVMPDIKDLLRLQEQWPTMPELAPWREAEAHLKQARHAFHEITYGASRS